MKENKTVYAKLWSAVIVDIFEEFLDSKGINIPNEDKEGVEGEAIIYGSDWDLLINEVSNSIKCLSENVGAEVNLEDWGNEESKDNKEKIINSFISDNEKMNDFFQLPRESFLESYSYLSDNDYNETIIDILNRTDLDIKNELIKQASELEGNSICNLVLSQMMIEWLLKRER